MFLSFLQRNRFEEAIAEADRTEELDPLWPGSSGTAAWILYYARRYDEAIRRARRSGTGFAAAYWVMGQAYEEQGRYKEAIEAFQRDVELVGGSSDMADFGHALLAHGYAVGGDRQNAESILNALLKTRQTAYFSAYNIAAIYAGLGDRKNVIKWLQTAEQERDPWVGRLAQDPRFDAYRSLPEVVAVQRKVDTPD
jgi:tetratricopeptide (TPR) repeat protein